MNPSAIFNATRKTDHHRAMNFGDFKDGKAQQPIPPVLAPHESEINDFAALCNKTCNRILNLLALGLEVILNYPYPQCKSKTDSNI